MPQLISFRARRATLHPAARRRSAGSRPYPRIGGKSSRTARGVPRLAATALSRMAPPPPAEAELARSGATNIDSLPVEMLTEVLLRVSTAAALVHAAAVSRSWRGAIATPEFLARHRERHTSSTFVGLYVPRRFAGPPSFHMPDSIRLGDGDARDVKDAALRAFDFDEIRRYQDHRLHDAVDNAFILGRLRVHPDCRLLDCHNSRLLLTRGDEALEVRSPLARETILLPFPPDVVDVYSLQACLLHSQDKAAAGASFRVVSLQHRRLGHSRQARAVEYDSRRKSWQDHPWETIKSNIIEGTPPGEVMHAGHRVFCKYTGLTPAVLVLDTTNMQFSVLPLPCYQSFVIGEIEDNVCCLVEAVRCADHRLRVWHLDEKLHWDLKKDIKMDQVLGEHAGYYRPRAISNGIALVCSRTTHRHFIVDLKTCSMKEEFEFHGQSAYPMQMPWPPVFSDLTASGEFDRDGGPVSVSDTRTGVGLPDWIVRCTQKLERATEAIADAGYQIAAILQDLKINAKSIVAAGPMGPRRRNWKRKPKYLAMGQRRRHLFSIASKISDEAQIATSSSTEASAASTDAVSAGGCKLLLGGFGSSFKFTDVGKQPIIDVSITSAPSLSDPSTGESAEQRGEVAQDSNEPQNLDIQEPTATAPTSATAEQCFGKDKNYVLNDYMIPDICDQLSDSMNPKAVVSAGECKLLLDGFGSASKFTDVAKQPIIDSSITSAPSLSDPSAGESAEQRGEAAQDSNEPQNLDIQEPTATAPTSATAEQCFGKDKNYVPIDYLIHDICDQLSDSMNPKAAGGFDRNGEPPSVGDARTGSGESETIEDLFGGTLAMAPLASQAVQPEQPLVWRSQSLNHDLLLQPPALASCPQHGKKRAGSRENEGSPKALGPGRCNWKRPKFLEAIFALRRPHSSKIYDELQIATSSGCREASAASTAAVVSTIKFTDDSGKQPIVDVSITSAPSLFYPSGELAEQRGEAARGKGSPETGGRGRRKKKLNPKYISGDWVAR